MANAMLAIMLGMGLSLAVAVLMERALFHIFLKALVAGPRRFSYVHAEGKTHLAEIRRAGL